LFLRARFVYAFDSSMRTVFFVCFVSSFRPLTAKVWVFASFSRECTLAAVSGTAFPTKVVATGLLKIDLIPFSYLCSPPLSAPSPFARAMFVGTAMAIFSAPIIVSRGSPEARFSQSFPSPLACSRPPGIPDPLLFLSSRFKPLVAPILVREDFRLSCPLCSSKCGGFAAPSPALVFSPAETASAFFFSHFPLVGCLAPNCGALPFPPSCSPFPCPRVPSDCFFPHTCFPLDLQWLFVNFKNFLLSSPPSLL